jgi:hypothetical protein
MTSKFVSDIKKCKLNYLYCRPALLLADNIISHQISKESWLDIYNYFSSCKKFRKGKIITYYYKDNYILEIDVTSGKKELVVSYQHSFADIFLEKCQDEFPNPSCRPTIMFSAENRYVLDEKKFPLLYEYDHVRQKIEYELILEGIIVKMELLLKNLDNSHISKIVSEAVDHENVFSYSFIIIVKEVTSDLEEHIDECAKRILYSI